MASRALPDTRKNKKILLYDSNSNPVGHANYPITPRIYGLIKIYYRIMVIKSTAPSVEISRAATSGRPRPISIDIWYGLDHDKKAVAQIPTYLRAFGIVFWPDFIGRLFLD